MSIRLLEALISNDAKIMQDLWSLDDSKINFTKLQSLISNLKTQIEVQQVLLSTERLLRTHPSNEALPNQLATRVKSFMKFVFERNKSTRGLRLRNLDCSSLKLFGLAYTLRELNELSADVFECFIENVAGFVQSRQLELLLCRDDINRVVHGDFDPEDEEPFKKFLNSMFFPSLFGK